MKSADGWQDVAIRNVSAHGMRISVALPPQRGAYIEIRRAAQVIVARIMWVDDKDCGIRTQDVVDVPALIDPTANRAEAAVAAHAVERRRAPRADETAARSQRFAARFQFAAMLAVILAGAGIAAWTVGDLLAAPFARVNAALEGK